MGLRPSVSSLGCSRTERRSGYFVHQHPFDELCLVVGGRTTITHAGEPVSAPPQTLFLFRAGEEHGYFNRDEQQPWLWVVHYHRDPALDRACPALRTADARQRIWHLDEAEVARFQELFLELQAEQGRATPASAQAASAWLRLLLVQVAQLRASATANRPPTQVVTSALRDGEVRELYELIQGSRTDLAALSRSLHRQFPGYDALRHRFKKAFGCSPQTLLMQRRMQQAQHLLQDSEASIGAIAQAVGYARQHEFSRAFHRHVGCTPGAWRRAGLIPSATR